MTLKIPRLVTVADIAEMYHLSHSYTRQAILRREVEPFSIGRRGKPYLWDLDAIAPIFEKLKEDRENRGKYSRIRIGNVKTMTGLTDDQIRRAIKGGVFPAPVYGKGKSRFAAWDRSEIEDWIDNRGAIQSEAESDSSLTVDSVSAIKREFTAASIFLTKKWTEISEAKAILEWAR